MNALEGYIKNCGQDEMLIMRWLKDAGVVPGNCVFAKDVVDDVKAAEWIMALENDCNIGAD